MTSDHDLPALADMIRLPGDLEAAIVAAAAERYPVPPDEIAAGPAIEYRYTGEPWAGITNDEIAEWAMSKLAAVDRRIQALKDHADALMAQIDNWFHQQVEKRQGPWPGLREQRAFFEAHLEAYARQQRDDKDRKTVALVSGEVTTRTQAARLVIEDEEALVDWASHHAPDMVRTRVDVQASTLNKVLRPNDDGTLILFAENGEPLPDAPPGVAVEPEHVTVKVKPGAIDQTVDDQRMIEGSGREIGRYPA